MPLLSFVGARAAEEAAAIAVLAFYRAFRRCVQMVSVDVESACDDVANIQLPRSLIVLLVFPAVQAMATSSSLDLQFSPTSSSRVQRF